MAALDGMVQAGGLYATTQPPQFSANLDEHTDSLLWDDRLYGNTAEPWQFAGEDNDEFFQSAPGLAMDGVRQQAYSDDFYYRVHLIPQALDLGNLLSAQTRDLWVWNAWFDPKLLSAVSASGLDGITVTEPAPAPTIFQPLEMRHYTINVAVDGPPIIDGLLQFFFPDESPGLPLSGRRVTIWPFKPRAGFTETLEWQTDIIGTFSHEQRLALRTAPRQSYDYRYAMDARQYTRARAISTQWSHLVYGVPVWGEAARLSGLSAGATSIMVDTTAADYRDDDMVILWASDTEAEALEITTVSAGSVDLKLPLSRNWGPCWIMPLRFARSLDGMEADRPLRDYASVRMSFDVTANADVAHLPPVETYRGKPVLLDCPLIVESLRERISRDVDVLDNGSGPQDVDVINAWVRRLATVALFGADRPAVWRLRQWLASRRGRQRAFWLPSGNHDLTIVQPVALNALAITIRAIEWPLYYGSGVQDLMIELHDGTRLFARITGATDGNPGEEILAVDGGLTTPGFLPGDVASVQFMMHVRQDADRITLDHDEAGHVSLSVPVLETPE